MSNSTYDPRITAYFGDAMLRAGFMPLPHLFLRHYHALGIGHAEAMFVLQLMEINWDLGAPPKTVNDIAQRMGVNARTVRRYSEAVAQLGLITLYDQYDETGAQVENGYDLSPLFKRLAAFAPEPPINGQVRRRSRRLVEPITQEQDTPSRVQYPSRHGTADKSTSPPPVKFDTRPHDIFDRAPGDNNVIATPDIPIRRPLIDSPGLKTERRIHQEQKNMIHDTSVQDSGDVTNSPGWSLRYKRPLNETDVAQTSAILQRAGIDAPVRSRIQTSLAPAEAWTLWVYALAKRWSVPLLINEIYDKAARCARTSNMPHRYDAVGILLEQIAPDIAEQIVRVVTDACSDTSVDPFAKLFGSSPDVALVSVVEKVWQMVADVRKVNGQPCPIPAALSLSVAPSIHTLTWTTVLERLATQIAPPDFSTWLQATTLLEVAPTCAVVGTDNIFVRERIEADYLDTIGRTLSDVLGRAVQVEVVIATS